MRGEHLGKKPNFEGKVISAPVSTVVVKYGFVIYNDKEVNACKIKVTDLIKRLFTIIFVEEST